MTDDSTPEEITAATREAGYLGDILLRVNQEMVDRMPDVWGPLSARDRCAITTALSKAAWHGHQQGSRAEVVLDQPPRDLWLEQYGDEAQR